jgi:hypothetical protein
MSWQVRSETSNGGTTRRCERASSTPWRVGDLNHHKPRPPLRVTFEETFKGQELQVDALEHVHVVDPKLRVKREKKSLGQKGKCIKDREG